MPLDLSQNSRFDEESHRCCFQLQRLYALPAWATCSSMNDAIFLTSVSVYDADDLTYSTLCVKNTV